MAIVDPLSIAVEPGGNVNAVADNPNGLMEAIALREGSYFDFFHAFDVHLGRVRHICRCRPFDVDDLLHVRTGCRVTGLAGEGECRECAR